VLVALLALFAALILFLFPAEHVQHRMRWLALGFFILGIGGLAFGYLLPILDEGMSFDTALYSTLAVRTIAISAFAIGLAMEHPPRVPRGMFLLVVPLLALIGALLALEAPRLPALSHLTSVESVADTSRTTMPGLTPWHWVLSLLPLSIALVAVYGAARHTAVEAFGGWLVVAMVLLAGSQLHSMFWPGAYSPILTTSSLLRAGFTIIVAVGAVLALIRVSAEREKMLASERAYAARLLDLGRLRANFTAMVAHELGNPLTAIDRSADLLAVDPLTPLQEKARATIVAEIRLMTALLADVRGAANAEHENFAIRPIPVSLDLLMADAAAYARRPSRAPGRSTVRASIGRSGAHRPGLAQPAQQCGQIFSGRHADRASGDHGWATRAYRGGRSRRGHPPRRRCACLREIRTRSQPGGSRRRRGWTGTLRVAPDPPRPRQRSDLPFSARGRNGLRLRAGAGMMTDRPIRLLLVDDHPTSRESLAMLLDLQPDMQVVGQAGTVAESRNLLNKGLAIDVALIDLDLPDGAGADLVQEICRASTGTSVLVLTASTDRRDHARAVEAGAVHVLHKSTRTAELIVAIRDIQAGKVLLDPAETAELLRLAREQRARHAEERAALDRLTEREREVLQLMAEGLDNQAIADRLFIGVETARTHVARLLRKLGIDSRLQAILLAYRHGIGRPD